MKYNKLLTYICLHRVAIKSFLLLILWLIAFVSIFVPKTIITIFSICSSFGDTGNESFKEKKVSLNRRFHRIYSSFI